MFQFFADSYRNIVSGLGGGRDKASAGSYSPQWLPDEQLICAYRFNWMARKAVDIPAFDMVRAWRNHKAEAQEIESIEAIERQLQIRRQVLRALKWSRLLGGAVAVMALPEGLGPLEDPLSLNKVGNGDLRGLNVFTRRALSVASRDQDINSPTCGQPLSYWISTGQGNRSLVHSSRVLRFGGQDMPELTENGDWGDPVLYSIDAAIKQATGSSAGIASLIQEAKVDVFKIKGLSQNAKDPAYQTALQARFEAANNAKSNIHALVMDMEEEWEQKQISFAQLPEVQRQQLEIVSGAADIPATRFLGQSPNGMSATGESDLRNYYDRVSADQELILRPEVEKLDEVLLRSSIGSRPKKYYFAFAPLWQLSEPERATAFKTKAEGARAIAGAGGRSRPIIPIEALSDALVNTFIEDGSLPGLEAAIQEYGRLSDQPEDEAPSSEAGGELEPATETNGGAPVGDATFRGQPSA